MCIRDRDESESFVQQKFPWVRIKKLAENYGFCRAVNEGIKMSRSPYVILLNNDTAVCEGFIKALLEEIKKDVYKRQVQYYYPFPDYKFPVQIFSDDYLPKEEDLVCSLETYDNDRLQLFDETAVFQDIVNSGRFDFFSNSFFVEIGRE